MRKSSNETNSLQKLCNYQDWSLYLEVDSINTNEKQNHRLSIESIRSLTRASYVLRIVEQFKHFRWQNSISSLRILPKKKKTSKHENGGDDLTFFFHIVEMHWATPHDQKNDFQQDFHAYVGNVFHREEMVPKSSLSMRLYTLHHFNQHRTLITNGCYIFMKLIR